MIYLVDSNVYIHSFGNTAFGESIRRFHQENLPRLVLSAVVVHELLIGSVDAARERALRKGLLEPFRIRQRLHVPTLQTWEMAASVDRRLRKRNDLQSKLQTRSFFNDMLIAASAREVGAIIVSENRGDFDLIASVLDIRCVGPGAIDSL